MKKEFKINDILNAVNSISRIERKKGKSHELKNDSNDKNDVLALNNQEKPKERDVLVLDEMIE